jgi:uncharacterized damage-inducible protein DinB
MATRRFFQILADYNAHANRSLFRILEEKAPAEQLDRPAGSYFDSILGLLNHLLVTDLAWLNGLRGSGQPFRSLDAPALDFQHPGWRKPLYHDLAGLRTRREAIDAVLQAFAAELTDEQLEGGIELADPRGQKHRFVLGEVLLHLFNHQTHHRGAIALALDQAGIENDFSNLLALLQSS